VPPDGPAPGSTGRLRELLAGWAAPQHRDGLALVLSSGLTSVIGLLYWVVAARLFPPEVVGVNNALISTMTLIAVGAQLNLGNALLRFVPVADRAARRLVLTCYALGSCVAAAAGGVFALGAAWWAPELRDAVGGAALVAFFVLSTPVWTVFVVQDYVLTALKRALVVPLENLVFSLLKIALLGAGALVASGLVIAVSWMAATASVVLAVTAYLLRVLPAPARGEPPGRSPVRPRAVARFVSADWTGGLFTNAVEFGLPLLVLVTLGAEQAATFGVAWAIAYGLYLVSHGMGQSLVAHVAADPEALDAARRSTVARSLALILPAAVVIVPGAGLILSVFGEHYAATGTALLALASLSAVPNAVVTAALFGARVQQRRAVLLGVPAAVAALVIPGALVLMPLLELTGVGVALVAGQTVVATAILVRYAVARRRLTRPA
jgi:O-antigen/teichoic acid export membrane protein